MFRNDAGALRVGGLDERISVLAPRDISVAVTTTAGEPDHRVGNVRTSALSNEEEKVRKLMLRQRHVGRIAVCLAVGLVCMLGIGVMSAYAKPLEHFSGSNRGSFVREDFCGDMRVRIEFDYDFTVVARESGPDRIGRYTVSSHGIETFTNLATGKTVTSFSDYITQDVRLTNNGDGTITILSQTPGAARYIGPDGMVVLIDPRPSWYEVVIDLKGTPNDPSDDSVISEELVREVAAHVDKDFCSAFRAATS